MSQEMVTGLKAFNEKDISKRNCIRVYLSFIPHKNLEIVCNREIIFLVDLTLEFASKTSAESSQKSWQMTCSQTFIGSSFGAGWMRGTLICN